MGNLTLEQMLQSLRDVDDMAWGRYCFSRDLLRDRVAPERRDEMIRRAIECGTQWAGLIQSQTGAADPASLVDALKLNVTESDHPMTEKGALFAQFTPDNNIEIMSHPLDTYAALYQKETGGEGSAFLPAPEKARELLLAHEIFHYIEETNSSEIYTRTETIRLWKIFCFKNDSTIRAIGEIAAMSFARTLAGVDYNPFILDILLFFGYNAVEAESIFNNIMAIASASKDKDGEKAGT